MGAPLLGWGLAASAGALSGILYSYWGGYFWWCSLLSLLLTIALQLKSLRTFLFLAEYLLLIAFGSAWAAFVASRTPTPFPVTQRIPVYAWCEISREPTTTRGGLLVMGKLEHDPPIIVQMYFREVSLQLGRGDRIKVTGELSQFDTLSFLSYGSRERYAAVSGTQARLSIHRILEVQSYRNRLVNFSHTLSQSIRARISNALQAAIPGEAALLSEALLLGNYAQLDPLTIAGFRRTGLLHLLALSGLQVMVMWALFEALGSILRLRYHYRMGFIVLCLFGYWWLLPDIASVDRAFVMALFLIAMRWSGKHHSPWQPWGGALLLLSLWQPRDVVTPGFQLSFAAVAGILFFVRHYQKIFSTPREELTIFRKIIRWNLDALLVSCFAILATMPVLVYHFGFLSFAGILLNLPAIPISNAILIGSILIVFTSPVTTIASLLGLGIAKLTEWLFALAMFPGMQWGPGSKRFIPLLFAVFTIFLTIHLLTRKKRRRAILGIGAACLFFILSVNGSTQSDARELVNYYRAKNDRLVFLAESERAAQRFTQYWLKQNGSRPVTVASRVGLDLWASGLPSSIRIVQLLSVDPGDRCEIEPGVWWHGVYTANRFEEPVAWGYLTDADNRHIAYLQGMSPMALSTLGWSLSLPEGNRQPIPAAKMHPSGEWLRQRWNDSIAYDHTQ